MRVATFRNDHGIAVHRNGELAERGEVLIDAAAPRLGCGADAAVQTDPKRSAAGETGLLRGDLGSFGRLILIVCRSSEALTAGDQPRLRRHSHIYFHDRTTT